MSSDLYNIVNNILIPHTKFAAATQKIQQCFRVAEGTCEPICLALIGESRTGKTRVLKHIESKYPRQRLDDGLRIPVLRVTTPAAPSIKGLAEAILASIGDPRPSKGTTTNLTNRIITQVGECKTRMIIIDEFQHFYDRELHKVKHHVADWFKVLVDECKVALVVSGLPTCQAVLNQNEQLAGRFLGPIHMSRFNWLDDEMREQFIAILDAFQTGLSQFDLPKLDSDEMAFRFYCSSGGLIGYVVKTLRQAVWNALDADTRRITLEDLARAHHEAIYEDERSSILPDAFSKGFTLMINEVLLNRVRTIGTASAEEVKVRPSRRKVPNPKLSEVLHA